jgi:hypothetical protein
VLDDELETLSLPLSVSPRLILRFTITSTAAVEPDPPLGVNTAAGMVDSSLQLLSNLDSADRDGNVAEDSGRDDDADNADVSRDRRDGDTVDDDVDFAVASRDRRDGDRDDEPGLDNDAEPAAEEPCLDNDDDDDDGRDCSDDCGRDNDEEPGRDRLRGVVEEAGRLTEPRCRDTPYALLRELRECGRPLCPWMVLLRVMPPVALLPLADENEGRFTFSARGL